MKTPRDFLLLALLAAFIAGQAVSPTTVVARERPNMVLLLADDLGYGDVRCFNPQSKIPTPHVDRLAREGMRFTDAHAPGALCVPSRHGLLTGRYPWRQLRHPNKEPVIEAGRLTIASLLRQQGYATAMVGKWHLGFEGGINFDYARPLRGGPVDRGFDHFYGMHASLDIPPYFYIENDRVVQAPTGRIEANHSPGWSPVQGAFWREGPIAPDFKMAEVLPRFTQKSVEWLEQHQRTAKDRPFFLYVAFASPHTPWVPLESFRGKSQADLYGDFVAQTDDAVGQVVQALERLGLADNTLVIFTSDNGPLWYPEDVQRFGHAATGIYRGIKGDAWEGGHRMPFIARWPGKIKPGTVSGETISFTDLLATFAAITGASLPDDAGEDSFNLLPALLGKKGKAPIREATVSRSSRGYRAIQQGPWKLIPGLGSGGFTQPSKVAPEPGGPAGQLYNLADDPGEQRNLYAAHPDVVQHLSALLERYTKQGHSRPLTKR